MRSFTIVSIEKTGGSKMQYKNGRFIGETPIQVVKKMFSHANRDCKKKCNSLKITLCEITQGSKKKEYMYRVTKVKNEKIIKLNNEDITFKFTTKVKSLN